MASPMRSACRAISAITLFVLAGCNSNSKEPTEEEILKIFKGGEFRNYELPGTSTTLQSFANNAVLEKREPCRPVVFSKDTGREWHQWEAQRNKKEWDGTWKCSFQITVKTSRGVFKVGPHIWNFSKSYFGGWKVTNYSGSPWAH